MFKRTLAYFLIFTLTFQCLGSLGVLTWFEVNRSYIANVLCENKDKPALHCNGQCVLMKKLKKLEDAEGKQQDVGFNKTEVLIVMPESPGLIVPDPLTLCRILPVYRTSYRYLYINRQFLPPKIA